MYLYEVVTARCVLSAECLCVASQSVPHTVASLAHVLLGTVSALQGIYYVSTGTGEGGVYGERNIL